VERVIPNRDCEVLADAAALLIAVSLDPRAAERAAALRDEPVREPEVVPVPVPVPMPVPEPQGTVKARVRRCGAGISSLRRKPPDLRPCVTLQAGGALQVGLLPGIVGPGVEGSIALAWPRVLVEAGGAHWFRRPVRLDADPTRGGDLWLTVGSLRACARLRVPNFEFPLCAGAELGALQGVGVGVAEPHRDSLLWIAGLAGASAAWVPVRRFAMTLGAELVVPASSYRFQVAGLGTVYEVNAVGGRFRLALAVRL
jgi:hypothetical protein